MEKIPPTAVSLVGIKHEFGENIVSNESIEKKYGKETGELEKKTAKKKGHEWVATIESPVAASLRCLEKILNDNNLDITKIGAVFGTTNPISVESKMICLSLTEVFSEKAGFNEGIEVYDESYGCGGSAIGIESMCKWLQGQPDGTYALYVTQDSPRKMVDDWNTEALFSDAVSVSLWVNNPSGIAEIESVFSSKSNISENILGIDSEGVWRMYGKGVVEDASQVPRIVAEELNINLADYNIAPHQPNAKLLESIEEMYNITLHKETAAEHGNPTCSGALIALEKTIENRDFSQAESQKDILVIPFGAGGYGGFILKHRPKSKN